MEGAGVGTEKQKDLIVPDRWYIRNCDGRELLNGVIIRRLQVGDPGRSMHIIGLRSPTTLLPMIPPS